MAHNEKMTARLREVLDAVRGVKEKQMFRGTAFMVNGKLCMSTGNDELMCRIDPSLHDELIQKNGCRTMVMKGKELKGYVYVHEDAFRSKRELVFWVNLCLEFNKIAKASKKKTSKPAGIRKKAKK